MTEVKGLMEIRKARGLSRREVAQRSGINFRSLQDYEQGHKNITSAKGETLYRLSLTLGCTIEDLLDRDLLEGRDACPAVGECRSGNGLRLSELKTEIEREEIYSKKYRIYGRWKVCGEICYLIFLYEGEIVRLPFEEEFTSGRFRRLAGRAAKQMDAYIGQRRGREE